MKIVCLSDTHSKYDDVIVPKGDMLIHAGDLDLYTLEDVLNFNIWLKCQPHKYKVVIGGNHDKWLAHSDVGYIRSFLTNTIYLENSGTEIEGIKIWGSPISPTFMNWYFMADRGEPIKKYWNLIPKDTDILISHSPPKFILDWTPFNYGEHNVGCQDLYNKVFEIKPKLHVFGHIHASYGIQKQKGITFINASCGTEEYQMLNKPIIYNYVK